MRYILARQFFMFLFGATPALAWGIPATEPSARSHCGI